MRIFKGQAFGLIFHPFFFYIICFGPIFFGPCHFPSQNFGEQRIENKHYAWALRNHNMPDLLQREAPEREVPAFKRRKYDHRDQYLVAVHPLPSPPDLPLDQVYHWEDTSLYINVTKVSSEAPSQPSQSYLTRLVNCFKSCVWNTEAPAGMSESVQIAIHCSLLTQASLSIIAQHFSSHQFATSLPELANVCSLFLRSLPPLTGEGTEEEVGSAAEEILEVEEHQDEAISEEESSPGVVKEISCTQMGDLLQEKVKSRGQLTILRGRKRTEVRSYARKNHYVEGTCIPLDRNRYRLHLTEDQSGAPFQVLLPMWNREVSFQVSHEAQRLLQDARCQIFVMSTFEMDGYWKDIASPKRVLTITWWGSALLGMDLVEVPEPGLCN
jgi:hypothetical protein